MSIHEIVEDFKSEIFNSEELIIEKALKMAELIFSNPEKDISQTKEFQEFLFNLSLFSVRAFREVGVVIVQITWAAIAMKNHPALQQRFIKSKQTLDSSYDTPDYQTHVRLSKARLNFENKNGLCLIKGSSG